MRVWDGLLLLVVGETWQIFFWFSGLPSKCRGLVSRDDETASVRRHAKLAYA